jgi:hypothetical protein
MTKITEEQCLSLLKEKFPNFIPYLEADIAYWGIEEGMTAQMMPFIQYAVDVIKSNNDIEIKKILDFAEFLLCNGDDTVQNGIATSFLEGLLNRDPEEIRFRNFCQYLGENSIDYCRAWDKFCGVRTEGLWDEEKNS